MKLLKTFWTNLKGYFTRPVAVTPPKRKPRTKKSK